ncbi:MAG TPA: hypothetical protein VFP22_07100 [Candidatus Limnocylindrales bacterium]|nr:hypothetical protein [Candidatus Limnocylindrales bacterium]
MTDTEPYAGAAATDADHDRDAGRADGGPRDRDADTGGGLTSADYSVAFSPRNVAIGLAIVAGIVGVAIGRRRRRTRANAGDPAADS